MNHCNHCGQDYWEWCGCLPVAIDRSPAPAPCSPSDTERLDWLMANGAYVSWSHDKEVCTVWYRWNPDEDSDRDGVPVEGWPQTCHYDAREAIDAAMRVVNAETNSGESQL